jgi:hypothetical protein
VTRTIKNAPYYHYPTTENEETPVFEYNTATTSEPSTYSARSEGVEECFENSKILPRSTIKKMNKRRRKLAQAIRRLNKLQRTYCLSRRPKPKNQKLVLNCIVKYSF